MKRITCEVYIAHRDSNGIVHLVDGDEQWKRHIGVRTSLTGGDPTKRASIWCEHLHNKRRRPVAADLDPYSEVEEGSIGKEVYGAVQCGAGVVGGTLEVVERGLGDLLESCTVIDWAGLG